MKRTAEKSQGLALWKRAAAFLLMLCVLLMSDVAAFADQDEGKEVKTETWGDYTYEILENDEAKIIEYTGTNSKSVKIPETLRKYKVTALGNYVFQSYFVFNDPIPSFLEEVEIPDSVKVIDGNPFLGCPRLTKIIVHPSNPYLAVIDNVLFCKTDKSIVSYPRGKTEKEYAIPEGIKIVGKKAFYECTALKQVTIPDGVTTIEEAAFRLCSNLTSVVLPDSVTSVGDSAFHSCDHLGKITLSSNLNSIGEMAFGFCKKLSSIELPDGLTEIKESAFAGCSALSKLTIPESVAVIGDSPFRECDRLSPANVSVMNDRFRVENGMLFDANENRLIQNLNKKANRAEIPVGTEIIGRAAFYGASGLASVTIPDTVKEIRKSAFNECRALKSIAIPKGVQTLEPWTFAECASLAEVSLPESLTEIGDYAFYNCIKLTEITISGGVKSIGWSAFSGCTKLKTVSIPGSVEAIDRTAFSGCKSLKNVVVEEGSYAESYCAKQRIPCTYANSTDWLSG